MNKQTDSKQTDKEPNQPAPISETLSSYIIGLAHIGHVVKDLPHAIANFKRVYGIGDDAISIIPPFIATGQAESAETRFAFIEINGIQFELIQPLSEHFTTLLFAEPSGLGGINHVAYQVSDIEAALECLAQQGISPGYVTPDGIIDFGPKKMLYLDPDTTGGLLIELIEIKPLAI